MTQDSDGGVTDALLEVVARAVVRDRTSTPFHKDTIPNPPSTSHPMNPTS